MRKKTMTGSDWIWAGSAGSRWLTRAGSDWIWLAYAESAYPACAYPASAYPGSTYPSSAYASSYGSLPDACLSVQSGSG